MLTAPPGDLFEDSRFRITIDGQTYEAPFDTDPSDLTSREIEEIGVLIQGDPEPVRAACAFLFTKLCRTIPLDPAEFSDFADQLAPMFDGDGSMIVFEDSDG